MKPAVWAIEARKFAINDRKRWKNGYFVLVLRDLQFVLEIPGNLPVNYDNLPVIYRLPVN